MEGRHDKQCRPVLTLRSLVQQTMELGSLLDDDLTPLHIQISKMYRRQHQNNLQQKMQVLNNTLKWSFWHLFTMLVYIKKIQLTSADRRNSKEWNNKFNFWKSQVCNVPCILAYKPVSKTDVCLDNALVSMSAQHRLKQRVAERARESFIALVAEVGGQSCQH